MTSVARDMFQYLIPAFILAASPSAQTDPVKMDHAQTDLGSTVTSAVRQWDFEAGDDVNFDRWPDDWRRRRGRGYPLYIDIGIAETDRVAAAADDNQATTNRALQIELDGNAATVFSPRVPISPVFSYFLEGRIKTDGLVHDVAYAEVRFYDADEKFLERHSSKHFVYEPNWSEFRIGPVTPPTDATEAVVALHVQPTEEADLRGIAWFDDLKLGNLPRVVLEMKAAHGLYTDPRDVAVTCRVSGFHGSTPVARFELIDIDNRLLESAEQTMSESKSARSGEIFSGSTSWSPSLPGPGFYQVRVSLPGHEGVEVERPVKLAVLADLPRADVGPFGWSFPNGDAELPLSVLVDLLPELGVHLVKFPVWHDKDETARAAQLGWFAERLASNRIQVVGMLDTPPQEFRDLFVDNDDLPAASIFSEPEIWQAAVQPVMQSLSLRVNTWQLGSDSDSSFVNYPNLDGMLLGVRDQFNRFGNDVQLGIVWPTDYEVPPSEEPSWSFLSHVAEPPMTADELRMHLSDSATAQRWLALQPIAEDEYDLATRARDLFSRMLTASIEGADAVFVPEPFDPQRGLMDTDGSPTELLLPWRTTAMMLAGTKRLGSLTLPNRSHNELFQRGDESLMVIWNGEPTRETIYLGDDVVQIDLWGRSTRPQIKTVDGVRRQVVEVGQLPTFLVGLDTRVARWRLSFEFETEKLASIFGRQQAVRYRFQNPFDQGIGGTLAVKTPDVWDADRDPRRFKLSAGEIREHHHRIALSSNANSGEQPVRLDFDITADRSYRFSVYRTLHVGLGDVEIEVATRLDANGNLIVEQQLINNTDELVSFSCLLFAPSRRRERRQLFNVPRGSTKITFVLRDGHDYLGKTLWLRAEEIDGIRVLNHHFTVSE